VIEFSSDDEEWAEEGCLSLPGWYGDVPRHSWVTVEYQDLDGKYRRILPEWVDDYIRRLTDQQDVA